MKIHQMSLARRVALPLLEKFGDFDVSIRHHYTGDRLRLNAFRHKGYWYLGKKREAHVMASFERLLRQGDTVIEVGGHIGYISLYFSRLVGDLGRVFVFEPGANNLVYTKGNLSSARNVMLIEKAVSDAPGRLPFYVEEMSGQNNSLIKDFWVFDNVAKGAFVEGHYREDLVDVVTLDDFADENGITPTFVKIDVEGAELNVLRGASRTIQRFRPMLMLEVNVAHREVYDFVLQQGYAIYDDKLQQFPRLPEQGMPNIFCIHRDSSRLVKAA